MYSFSPPSLLLPPPCELEFIRGARSARVPVADWEEGVVGLGSPVSQRPGRREARGAATVKHRISRPADRLFFTARASGPRACRELREEVQEVRAWLWLLRGGHNSESPRSGACVGQAGGGGGGSAGKPQRGPWSGERLGSRRGGICWFFPSLVLLFPREPESSLNSD